MSLWSNLNEAFRHKKVGNVDIAVDDSMPQSVQEANYQELATFLQEVSKVTKSREELISEIDEMVYDSIIASALELLADDATQIDPMRDKTVWVTSKDDEITKYLNDFLEDIGVEDNIWTWAYQVIKYGDLYLKTYHSEFAEGKEPEELKDLKGYIYERIYNPAQVSELQKYGFAVGYSTKISDKKIALCPTDDYIHFINDRMGKRAPVTLTYDKNGVEKTDDFKVRYGTCAFESARQAWAMLSLIEMLLIYVRFGKSAFYRMFKVEVGGASRNEIMRILRETKAAFSVQDNLDVNARTYRGIKKPLPHGENIYLPVKQGKGDITVEAVGGDFNPDELIDLEYWRNKLFAALKMPKAYLGFEETQPGGLGNISLTRQDIRYARSVKVIKRVLRNGLIDLIDFHLKEVGKEDYIGKYELEMTQVMSAETSDIEDNLLGEISLAEALKTLLSDAEGVDSAALTRVIIGDILNLADKFPELFKGGNSNESGEDNLTK